jgi:hypothetical protein
MSGPGEVVIIEVLAVKRVDGDGGVGQNVGARGEEGLSAGEFAVVLFSAVGGHGGGAPVRWWRRVTMDPRVPWWR